MLQLPNPQKSLFYCTHISKKPKINVKGIDRKTYLEFKAEATRRGMAVGKAVTEAMLSWLEGAKKR